MVKRSLWGRLWERPSHDSEAHTASSHRPAPQAAALPRVDEPTTLLVTDGVVWIDTTGMVRVKNPQPHGRYAVLSVPDDQVLTVLVNGEVVRGDVVLEEEDQVQVRLASESPRSDIFVVLSDDHMEAWLHVTYTSGKRWVLRETHPDRHLALQPEMVEVRPHPITESQVRVELSRKGVVAGIVSPEQWDGMLNGGQSGRWLIAQGVMPRSGRGILTCFQPPDVKGAWQVDIGTVVGQRRAEPARDGTTVTGEVLVASAQDRERVDIGPGINLMNRGANLVANCVGQVVFEDHIVDVVPHTRQSSRQSDRQPMVVPGNLTIDGPVMGRMVFCSGNLNILGSVDDATLVAGGTVAVHGDITHSEVFEGLGAFTSQFAKRHVSQLIDGLADLEITLGQLERQSLDDPVRFSQLIARVIPDKFPDVLEAVTLLFDALRWPSVRWDDHFAILIKELHTRLDEHYLSSNAYAGELRSFSTELQLIDRDSLVHEVPTGQTPGVRQYQRVIDTKIHAKGVIEAEMLKMSEVWADQLIVSGTVDGGWIHVRERLTAQEIGTDGGQPTEVEVTSGELVCDRIHPGVVTLLNGVRKTISDERTAASYGAS